MNCLEKMYCDKFLMPSCSKDSADELLDARKLVRLCAESFGKLFITTAVCSSFVSFILISL